MWELQRETTMHIESISTRVSPVVRRPGFQARVESAFAEAVNLVTPHGAALALVSRRIGNGPLNAVVSQFQTLAPLLHPGDTIHGDGAALSLGQALRLALAPAVDWDPHPDYSILARLPRVVAGNLGWLRHYLLLEAPPTSLAAPRPTATPGATSGPPASVRIQMQAGELIDGLTDAHSRGDLKQVAALASRLAGLGPGLTPAGDDWLAGWLVGLRAAAAMDDEDRPLAVNAVAQAVAGSAGTRTSRLSLAFLQAAGDGAVAQAWHALLAALPDPDRTPLRRAAAEIMRHGATSGSDMLAGFLAAPFPSFP